MWSQPHDEDAYFKVSAFDEDAAVFLREPLAVEHVAPFGGLFLEAVVVASFEESFFGLGEDLHFAGGGDVANVAFLLRLGGCGGGL
jgi:hypothetical protein